MKKLSITNKIYLLGNLTIIIIFSLGLNATYWSDDYVYFNRLSTIPFLSYFSYGYLTWDGRFVSLQALVQALLIKYTSAPFAVFFWSSMMLLLAVFFRLIIRKELSSKADIPASLIFIFLWYGFSFHLSETVYRVVGGFYIMSLVIAFGWIWFYINKPWYLSLWWLSGGFLFSIIAGVMGVNGSVTLITFLLVSIIYDYPGLKVKPELLWYPGIWGIALIVGTLFSIAAPGNYIRASYHTSSFDLNILSIVLSGMEIFARYSYYSLPAVAMALILAMVFPSDIIYNKGLNIFIQQPAKYLSIFKSWSFKYWVYELRWLIAGISSIVPILLVPAHSGRRTSVFFMAFLFLWVVVFFYKLFYLKSLPGKVLFSIRLSAHVLQTILIVFLLFTIGLALQHFHLGCQIRYQVEAREAYFDSIRGSADTVYVAPIVVDYIPFTYKFHDYLHRDYAKYFGFEAVILDTSMVKQLPHYYLKPP